VFYLELLEGSIDSLALFIAKSSMEIRLVSGAKKVERNYVNGIS
jgi:hypothetical protein